MIVFQGIPDSIRKPGIYGEFNTSLARAGLPALEVKVLLIGAKLAGGSQAVHTPVAITGDRQGEVLFGAGSELDLMIKAAFTANPSVALFAVAVAEAVGTKAAATVTFTGPATGDGYVQVRIAGRTITSAVTSADTATEIAATVVADWSADADAPVVAAQVAGVVTFTAKLKGLNGNALMLSCLAVAAGVTATASGAHFTLGTGSIDIESCLAAMAPSRYHLIVVSECAATVLADLCTHLDANASALEQRGQQGVAAHTGTLAEATSLATTANAARLQVALCQGTETLPYELAAAVAAVRAGQSDPAYNFDGALVRGVLPPAEGSDLTRVEQEAALHNGVTPICELGSGRVNVIRSISTYVEDGEGFPDVTLLDTATLTTLDYMRDAVVAAVRAEHGPGNNKATARKPGEVRATIIRVFKSAEALDIVRDIAANLKGFVVEESATVSGRLNAKVPTPVVPGLHVVALRFDLLV
jgi:phage tail sheath gpL-like